MEVECCGQAQWTCSVLPSAAGSTPSPSTPPPTPTPDSPPDLASLDLDDWDWLDPDAITPVVEELEQLANSLFAEACDAEGSKASEENLVGQKAESLEPCWSCFENSHLDSSDKQTSVTYSNFQKSDKKLAQESNVSNIKTLDTSTNISQSLTSLSPNPKPIKSCNETTNTALKMDELRQPIVERGERTATLFNPELKLITPNQDETSFPEECMDCVVNEEVVETTDIDTESMSSIPSVVLTEAVDLQMDSETIDLDENLLVPGDLIEESSSDHGYESYDSPISEPDQLVNLFPELW